MPEPKKQPDVTKIELGPKTLEVLAQLSLNIRTIASGRGDGPDGLEAVAMALAGPFPVGTRVNAVSDAIDGAGSNIGNGLSEIAQSIQALATAVESVTDSVNNMTRAAYPLSPSALRT